MGRGLTHGHDIAELLGGHFCPPPQPRKEIPRGGNDPVQAPIGLLHLYRKHGRGQAGAVGKETYSLALHGERAYGVVGEEGDEAPVEGGRVHVAHLGGQVQGGLCLQREHWGAMGQKGLFHLLVEISVFQPLAPTTENRTQPTVWQIKVETT